MKIRLLKYIGTGIINTLFGYGFYALLLYYEMIPSYALLIATVMGLIFNYQTNKHYVFNDFRGNFFRFCLSYAVIYIFNLMLLNGALYFLTSSAYFAQILCLPPTVIIGYFILKNFSFKKEFAHGKENH